MSWVQFLLIYHEFCSRLISWVLFLLISWFLFPADCMSSVPGWLHEFCSYWFHGFCPGWFHGLCSYWFHEFCSRLRHSWELVWPRGGLWRPRGPDIRRFLFLHPGVSPGGGAAAHNSGPSEQWWQQLVPAINVLFVHHCFLKSRNDILILVSPPIYIRSLKLGFSFKCCTTYIFIME